MLSPVPDSSYMLFCTVPLTPTGNFSNVQSYEYFWNPKAKTPYLFTSLREVNCQWKVAVSNHRREIPAGNLPIGHCEYMAQRIFSVDGVIWNWGFVSTRGMRTGIDVYYLKMVGKSWSGFCSLEQCDRSYGVAFASKLAGHPIASVTHHRCQACPWRKSLSRKIALGHKREQHKSSFVRKT